MKAANEVSLGVFEFERETKNTKRFSRENGDGRSEVQCVNKAVLAELGNPESIEVVVRVGEEED